MPKLVSGKSWGLNHMWFMLGVFLRRLWNTTERILPQTGALGGQGTHVPHFGVPSDQRWT